MQNCAYTHKALYRRNNMREGRFHISQPGPLFLSPVPPYRSASRSWRSQSSIRQQLTAILEGRLRRCTTMLYPGCIPSTIDNSVICVLFSLLVGFSIWSLLYLCSAPLRSLLRILYCLKSCLRVSLSSFHTILAQAGRFSDTAYLLSLPTQYRYNRCPTYSQPYCALSCIPCQLSFFFKYVLLYRTYQVTPSYIQGAPK